MTAKEYLNQYRRCENRIQQLNDRIERLESNATGGALNYDGMPHGSRTADRMGDIVAEIADIQTEVAERRIEAIRIREEIADVIDRVPDAAQSTVLYDRYILRMKWEDIAEAMNYSQRQVLRIHGDALQNMRELLKRCH